jgi:hypothetical protein
MLGVLTKRRDNIVNFWSRHPGTSEPLLSERTSLKQVEDCTFWGRYHELLHYNLPWSLQAQAHQVDLVLRAPTVEIDRTCAV